jgi:glycosyl transferase family 25
MLNYKVLVINLQRSPGRLAKIKQQLEKHGVEFERIEAVDGAQLSDDFIEQVSPAELVRANYYRPLSNGEIACSLSHKKAWQKIIDDNLDFGVVLEDDLQLLDNFKEVIQLLSNLPTTQWDFIKLYPLTRSASRNINQAYDYQSHTFVTYHKFPLGCQGQAISLKGARALVNNMLHVKEPVDSQLKSWWELGIYPFGLLPYCISTEIGGESDINPTGRLEQIKQNKLIKAFNKVSKAFQRLLWQPRLKKAFNDFTNSLK